MLLALAALSKLQGLGLFLLAGLVVLAMAWQRRDWRLPWRALLFAAPPVLLIAGWWYVRNVVLYGDLFGLSHLLTINGRRQNPLTWDGFWREFRGLRYSFWGLFGWFNILLPSWIYRVLDGLTLLALAGLGGWGVLRLRAGNPLRFTRATDRVRVLLLTWAALSLLLLLYWTNQATGSQGRLIFPGLSAFAILLAGGLEAWLRYLPARVRGWGQAIMPGVLLGATLLTLFVLLPQAYRAPHAIAALPEDATPLDLRYGADEQLRLAAIALPDQRFQPGDDVPITLFTRAPAALDQDYRLFIQLLDDQRNVLGNVTTHPGWGRNPTTLWQADVLYPDAYRVRIDEAIDIRSPLLATVYVGFINPAAPADSELPLPAVDAAGASVTPFAGQVVIEPHRPLLFEELALAATAVEFGEVIELAGVRVAEKITPGDLLPISLLWHGLAQPATDYTAFVHLRSPDGRQVAGFDAAPAQGRFPTARWRSGDRVLSEFELAVPADVPPGLYEVWVGLYETGSAGALRLPLTKAGGIPTGDGEVMVGMVAVE